MLKLIDDLSHLTFNCFIVRHDNLTGFVRVFFLVLLCLLLTAALIYTLMTPFNATLSTSRTKFSLNV